MPTPSHGARGEKQHGHCHSEAALAAVAVSTLAGRFCKLAWRLLPYGMLRDHPLTGVRNDTVQDNCLPVVRWRDPHRATEHAERNNMDTVTARRL